MKQPAALPCYEAFLLPPARHTGMLAGRFVRGGKRAAGVRGGTRPGRRTRTGVAALQLALSLTLLVGALLFVQTLRNLRDMGNLSGAKYDNSNLKEVLTREFAGRAVSTLDDLARRVLIPAFDLDDGQDARRKLDKPRTWKPKFFHNYPGPDSDGAELIVDVAMRTSAAPTYFPTV